MSSDSELNGRSTPSLQQGCVSETWETLWFLSRWVHIIVGELKRWTCVIHLLIIMDVIDAEYQCHKQNTSSQEKSCVNRASFVFMANFENFFLRFVMNSYILFFSLLLILSITRPWNKPCDLNLQSKSKTFFSMFTRFTVLRFFPHYFYSFKANTNVVCSRQIPQNHNIL